MSNNDLGCTFCGGRLRATTSVEGSGYMQRDVPDGFECVDRPATWDAAGSVTWAGRESAPATPDPHVSYVPGEDPQTAALREMVNDNRERSGIDGDGGVRGVAESWRMFANHRDGEWFYAFPEAWYVEAHGREPEAVLVTELPTDAADEDVDGFGWIDTAERVGQEPDGVPGMIWPRLFLLEMCFPYGLKAETERGRGRLVKLRIERADVAAPERGR